MILIKHNNEGNLKAYFYFALEEYVMEHLLKEDEAYFFTWKIKGIVIGKNQVLENEVNLQYTKEKNIEILVKIPFDTELGELNSNGKIAVREDYKNKELFYSLLNKVKEAVE